MLSWKPMAVLGLALVVAVLWGLYERRGAQLEAERAEGLAKQVERLAGDLKRQEREAAIRQSITDAADRAVVSVETGRDVIRSRVVTIVREIRSAPDANDLAPDSVRVAVERVRQLDAGTDRGDTGGAAGSAAGPAARP